MISKALCERVLGRAVSTGADYAELFMENTLNHSIEMVGGKVDAINDGVIAGAAIRVYKGLRSVMASTVDTGEEGLMRCAQRVADALGEGKAEIAIRLSEQVIANIHPVLDAPSSVANARKVDILRAASDAAKGYNQAVRQVTGRFLDVDHNILIASTDGVYARDRQIRTRLVVSAVAELNGQTQTGSCSPGRRMGMEMFDGLIDPVAGGRHAGGHRQRLRRRHLPRGLRPLPGGQLRGLQRQPVLREAGAEDRQ